MPYTDPKRTVELLDELAVRYDRQEVTKCHGRSAKVIKLPARISHHR
jgi:hypothetical protein